MVKIIDLQVLFPNPNFNCTNDINGKNRLITGIFPVILPDYVYLQLNIPYQKSDLLLHLNILSSTKICNLQVLIPNNDLTKSPNPFNIAVYPVIITDTLYNTIKKDNYFVQNIRENNEVNEVNEKKVENVKEVKNAKDVKPINLHHFNALRNVLPPQTVYKHPKNLELEKLLELSDKNDTRIKYYHEKLKEINIPHFSSFLNIMLNSISGIKEDFLYYNVDTNFLKVYEYVQYFKQYNLFDIVIYYLEQCVF